MLKIFSHTMSIYKKTIVSFIFIFILLTSIYNYFTNDCYLAKATIEVENRIKVSTEVEIIKSRLLLSSAIKKVNLSHRYYVKEQLRERELYKESPFEVYLTKGDNLSFDLYPIDNTHYRLVSKGNNKQGSWEYDKIHSYAQRVSNRDFNLIITLKEDIEFSSKQYRFSVENEERIIKNIQKNLQVKQLGDSSIIEISYVDTISHRSIDFVNLLADTAVKWSRESKNKKRNKKISLADIQLGNTLSPNVKSIQVKTTNEDANLSDKLLDKESEYLDKLSQTLKSDIDNNLSLASLANNKLHNDTNESKRSMIKNTTSYQNTSSKNTLVETTIVKENKKYILDRAIESRVVNLHPAIILLFGLLIGFIFGIFVAFMKSLSDDRIKTYKYLEEKCKNTLLGYIPHFEKSFDEEGMQIPDLMTSESFRVVRDNLKFMVTDPASQVICVTSHSDEDGKSTVVTHLAESFSHGEQRVIVLDLDMQNPTMHQKFHLFNDDGMSTVLSHRAMISNAIEYTTNENLDIVTAGSPPPNPWELIRSQRMLDVIKKLKNVYDIIIIDTPSVGIDKERAKALAFADVTLYVLRANVTKKDIINDLDSFALLLNDVR